MKPDSSKFAKIESAQDEDENLEQAESEQTPFSSLKSRAIWLFATLFIAIILLLFAIPGFFDNSALKFKIEQKASEFISANLAINGNVTIAFLPYPSITAQDVVIQNYAKNGKVYNLYAKSFKLKLAVIELLQKEFLIDKVIFSDATLESIFESNIGDKRENKLSEILSKFSAKYDENKSQKIESSISSDLFSVDKFQSSQFSFKKLPTIEVENGMMISYDRYLHKKEIEEINFKLMLDSEKIRASGKFSNEKVVNNFKFSGYFKSDTSKNNSVLEINSSTMNLTIKGSFTGENSGIFTSAFIGKAEAEIFEIRSFYKDYISNGNAIYEKLKKNSQSIKISSDIKNDQGEISLNNLVINSDLINGKGSAMIDFTSDIPRLDIILDLENLDLDSIWSKERIITASYNENFDLPNDSDETIETLKTKKPIAEDINTIEIKPEDKSKNLTVSNLEDLGKTVAAAEKKPEKLNLKIANKVKNIDLSAEIKIKNVKYIEGQIKDLSLYLTISNNGQVLILPMIFKVPGEGVMRISGVLENDNDLPKFIGKLDISGENLGDTLKWLDLESQNLKFGNLKNYIVYSDVMLLPNNIILNNFYLNLNKSQSEFLGEIKIDSSTKISSISNKFQVSTFNIDDFFLTSGQNIYLSPGSLLKKLLWLNEINSNHDISLTFDKLIYKGEEFSDQSSLKLSFGQGYIKISELNLKSEKTNLQAKLTIDLSDQNPEFEISLIADNFHYEVLQNKNSEFEKDSKKKNIADQFFALPSLEGFSGSVNFVINNLKLEDLEINNAKIAGKLKDGNIPQTIASCDIYGGSLDYKGLIGIKDYKTINGNLTLKNILLEELLPDLSQIENIKGTTNISANITSVADSKEKFITEANSEIKFSTNAPEVAGYGLSDLVNKMFYVNNFRQELQNPDKILSNPNSKTIFNQASGTITLDKDKGGKFSIKMSSPAINGVLSGKVDIAKNSIDGLANIIFVTGSRQKQIPLNIVSAIKGNMGEIVVNSNLDQVKQYLGIIKVKPAESKSQLLNSNTNNNAGNTSANTTNQKNVTSQIQNRQQQIIKSSEDAQKIRAMEQIKAATIDPNFVPQNLDKPALNQ
ncbi:MAG: AsmA family protein [Proteobacteria bacterium]|nr:AsmA family protein [Pseudomonadota bacterium]